MGDAPASGRAAAPVAGDVVDGKFRVVRRIGEGGMGLVLEAVHLKLDERVALKFLRPDALERPDVVARFAQEARAAVKLKSEHVARVIDVGEHQGLPFMVMEFLEGNDLEEILAKNGPLKVEEAVEFVIQACEGINEAHARGIVHRDIKPANLFVAQSGHGWGTVKVLDFGISKAALTGKVSDVDLASRKTTSVMGSPYYMSPEQLRSTRDVDRRTDIWALGAVLFELLTGRTAFVECDDFPQLVVQILEQQPRRLSDFMTHPPGGLQAILDRCFAKDREQRFSSAAELAIALVPYANSRNAAVIASRAAKVTRSSGIDPALRTPWSLPPPSDSDVARSADPALKSTDLTLTPAIPPAPRPPALSGTTHKELVLTGQPRAAKSTATTATLAAIALAVVLVLGVVALRGGATSAAAPAAIASAVAPAAPASASDPLPNAPAAPAAAPVAVVAPPATESAAPAIASAAAPKSGHAARGPATKNAAAAPPAPASSGSKHEDLEIRRER